MSIFHYVKLSCAVLLISVIGSPAVAASHASHHSAAKRSSVTMPQRVDINRANVSTLAAVKGLSHKQAQAIVDWRYQHGSFKKVADLAQVHGISSKLLVRIGSQLVVQ